MLFPVNCFQNPWMKVLKYFNQGNLRQMPFPERILKPDYDGKIHIYFFLIKSSRMASLGKSL
jgi:hypothetical protein